MGPTFAAASESRRSLLGSYESWVKRRYICRAFIYNWLRNTLTLVWVFQFARQRLLTVAVEMLPGLTLCFSCIMGSAVGKRVGKCRIVYVRI